MCGIAGVVNFNGEPLEWDLCMRLSKSVAHRGPDDSGEYRYEAKGVSAGFVHRRLNIIDLSAAAHQPISNENGKLWLVYNGEIYNYAELRSELSLFGHRFKSHSDSEVVLHAFEEWGQECLQKFIGMWAFSVWDESSQSLFCARDRLGIKPFYYSFEAGKQFIFASELKSFLALGEMQSLNYNALYSFLCLGYSLGEVTWIKGVKKLLPGHCLYLKNGSLEVKQYWDASNFTGVVEDDEDVIRKKLRTLMEDSVSLCMRSDVPVGAYLSGGIDSTSIVSLMSRKSDTALHTFSGVFSAGEKYDESVYISEAERAFSLEPTHVLITAKRFMKVMNEIAWHLDEPIVGPGSYAQYHVCELIKNEGFKVVVGGQGGDELFAGYYRYLRGIPFNALNDKNTRRYIGNAGFRIKSGRLRIRGLIKQYLSFGRMNIKRRLKREITDSLSQEYLDQLEGPPLRIEDMLLWDLKNYLPSLLQVEDRIGMAHSIETRFPLLDHRLVEMALSIPYYLKTNSFALKYILREAVKDAIPRKIYERKDKMGFSTPFNEWVRDENIGGSLREEITPYLAPYFKKPMGLTWEYAIIGLWLKKTGVK